MITNTNVATRRKKFKYEVCFPNTKTVLHTNRTLKGAKEWAAMYFANTGMTYFISRQQA